MLMLHARAFRRDSRGGVLLIVGLALPALMAMGAAAVEYGSLVKRRTELQRAADAGSIAGVNQFKLANADDAAAVRSAIAMAKTQAQAQGPSGADTNAAAEVLGNHSSVRVTLTETVPLSLGKLLSLSEVKVTVSSTAKLSGTTRLCLLALDPAYAGAFHLEKAARITASDCSLYSNSLNPSGIRGENNAVVRSLSTCTAGGYTGSRANFLPPPATGCPALRDPLIDRAPPPVGPCVVLGSYVNPKKGIPDVAAGLTSGLVSGDTSGLTPILDLGVDNPVYGETVVSGVVTLDPGTYCGGLHVTKKAQVTLRPGVYVMKDGPLVVDKNASLTGANVGFFFTGDRGGLLFDKNSVISLTAPKDGPLAGLLLFEDRNVGKPVPLPLPYSGKGPVPAVLTGVTNLVMPGLGAAVIPFREYRIISDEARTLLGTIYLPAGRLIIDSNKTIADQSAYTVIIARLINLYDGPNLMLNARYGASDIPVPEGVGPSSADTVISQ